jgi:hypothetical protein
MVSPIGLMRSADAMSGIGLADGSSKLILCAGLIVPADEGWGAKPPLHTRRRSFADGSTEAKRLTAMLIPAYERRGVWGGRLRPTQLP